MYWCALIRIHCAQINQTFHSTILVFIIVVSLHSDAYLRSLTLSHKIGGEQNVLDQYNLAKNVLDQFFSLEKISVSATCVIVSKKDTPNFSASERGIYTRDVIRSERDILMTEREGKEDDRGGTAEVRFILFIFTARLLVVVLRGF